MSAASAYWMLIRIDAKAGCKREDLPAAQAFFQFHFPHFISGADVPELAIQRQLMRWCRGEDLVGEPECQALAQLCLRCFISKHIEQTCIQLETKFGSDHGFSRYDLFPFVLTDVGIDKNPAPRTFRSLATEILQTFDPDRGSLTSWTIKLVKQHRELNHFLLQQGVYLISDWAILNDTAPEQLARIFAEVPRLTNTEIQQARLLLKSYHTIYRRDRLASNQTGQCLLPTSVQLQQIARSFHAKTHIRLSPYEVMARLQDMAELLREHRLSLRRGILPSQSLDDPNISRGICEPSYRNDPDNSEEVQAEFLTVYRQEFLNCLDRAIAEVIWQAYLNALALLGFEKWLEEWAPDLPHFLDDGSVFHPAYANVLGAVCNLRVGEFKVCLIPMGSLTDKTINLPRAAIELSEFMAHFYVIVEVIEELKQVNVGGFGRYDQLKFLLASTQLSPDLDWNYRLPQAWLDNSPDRLLLYLRCLGKNAIALPADSTQRPTRLAVAQLEALLPQLRSQDWELWEVLSWEQATAILTNPELLNWLLELPSSYSTEVAQHPLQALEEPDT
ncbi:MAG TPA: hypothetical protein DDZ80_23775 [Cyanobacteria bacterium UBA8803]|nr:hypothetical protein [Cyanobacteria bacterium UBA9273]HBL61338.1 hypothetical protein [Cyanobacteria bacterium UBA8803]